MPSKVYAISAPSAAIALRYGKNVSKGILKMEEKIAELEHEVEIYSEYARDRA